MKLKTHVKLLAYVWAHTPLYACFFLVEGVLMGINQAIGIHHIKHIFDLLAEGAEFASIAHILLEFAVYLLIHYAFYHWFRDCYQPRAAERMHVLLGVRVSEHDDSGIVDVRKVTAPVDELLEDMGHVVSHTVSTVFIVTVLFQTDVLVACISLIACAVRLSVVLFHDHLAVRHHHAIAEMEENEDALGAFNLKVDALRDFSQRKRALISEGNRRLARITFLAEGSMTIIDFGIIVLMLYKLTVPGTATLGGAAVSMTSLWVLSWQLRGLFERLQHFCKGTI